jgi:hypothetical protein
LTHERASVSIDGEQYIPRRLYDELRAERDRLAQEVERLGEQRGGAGPEPDDDRG